MKQKFTISSNERNGKISNYHLELKQEKDMAHVVKQSMIKVDRLYVSVSVKFNKKGQLEAIYLQPERYEL